MGALTSKPYAFTARPWELRTHYSLDFLDSVVSKIRLDFRGLDVMRVLPVVFDQISDEWITDKIRFSYDAFRRQRLLQVLIKQEGGFIAGSLREAFTSIYEKASAFKFSKVAFVVGKAVDIESLFSAKLWGRSWFTRAFFLQDFLETPYNVLPFFKLKNNLFLSKDFLDSINYLCFLGSNLRYEAPLLNLLIKQKKKDIDFFVFSLGVFIKNTYFAYNIGSNISNFNSLIKGKLKLSSYISQNRGLFIMGNIFFKYIAALRSFSSFVNSSFVYVSAFSSLLNMFAVNFTNNNPGVLVKLNNTCVFNLSIDFDIRSITSHNFNIFLGSHGNAYSNYADCILPSAHFFEKKFNMLNVLGEQQQSQQGTVSKGQVRSEVSYFYALDKFFYFSHLKARFASLYLSQSKLYAQGLFFNQKGKFKKPQMIIIKNRWKNLYNPLFGRLYTYRLAPVFIIVNKTKNIWNVSNKLLDKYINNYMFTHTYTQVSHFVALATKRYSHNISNFNND